MGFRFYRRVRICPGVSVNLSGGGPSLSLGVRGAHVTLGRRGITRTVGLPGTGLFYTSRSGYHTGYHSAAAAAATPRDQAAAEQRVERIFITLLVLGAVVLIERCF